MIDMNGWTYGAKAGYDFVIAPTYVLGVVADISHTSADGNKCVAVFGCNPAVDAFAYGEMKWFGTLRAKAGMTLGNPPLYATGGVASARFKSRITHLHTGTTPDISDSHTHTGWVVGAGIDYMVYKQFSVDIEYLHADFGSKSYSYDPTIVGAAAGASGSVKMDFVRTSISCHF